MWITGPSAAATLPTGFELPNSMTRAGTGKGNQTNGQVRPQVQHLRAQGTRGNRFSD